MSLDDKQLSRELLMHGKTSRQPSQLSFHATKTTDQDTAGCSTPGNATAIALPIRSGSAVHRADSGF
jgi:hypothetical protein